MPHISLTQNSSVKFDSRKKAFLRGYFFSSILYSYLEKFMLDLEILFPKGALIKPYFWHFNSRILFESFIFIKRFCGAVFYFCEYKLDHILEILLV